MKKLIIATIVVLAAIACSENDNTEAEFENWQSRNELWFKAKSDSVAALIAQGRTDWRTYRSWKYSDTYQTTDITKSILVQVLKEGSGSGCPLYTDSIRMHYQMRLIPSNSYPSGYVFDQSYYGTYSPETSVPKSFVVSGLIDGVATALQHMHIGDHWLVYVPYPLGYGESSTSSVPAYSTLICDLTLAAYSRAGEDLPDWSAREGGWWGE